MELELIAKLKPLVGLAPGAEIPKQSRRIAVRLMLRGTSMLVGHLPVCTP